MAFDISPETQIVEISLNASPRMKPLAKNPTMSDFYPYLPFIKVESMTMALETLQDSLTEALDGPELPTIVGDSSSIGTLKNGLEAIRSEARAVEEYFTNSSIIANLRNYRNEDSKCDLEFLEDRQKKLRGNDSEDLNFRIRAIELLMLKTLTKNEKDEIRRKVPVMLQKVDGHLRSRVRTNLNFILNEDEGSQPDYGLPPYGDSKSLDDIDDNIDSDIKK